MFWARQSGNSIRNPVPHKFTFTELIRASHFGVTLNGLKVSFTLDREI